MNLQRFVLPATIAAAFHAVMLCALPDVNVPQIFITPANPPEPKPPQMPVDVSEPPPAKDPDTDKEVVPLGGGNPRPELPDVLSNLDVKTITVPMESRPTEKLPLVTPGIIGPSGPFGPGRPDGQPPKIILAKNLDQIPRATVRMSPDYPPAMKRDSVQGTVLVEFDVDVNGRVTSAKVRESTHRAFEAPTLRAVLKWRFEPGLNQGLPVPFRMVIPVNFTLGAE